MPADLFANNASTTLAAGITSGATSLTVASSAGFPVPTSGASLFRVLIGSEILTVTAVSGTTWTVTRGAESTVAAAHSSGDAVTMVVTAGALGNLGIGGGDYFRTGYYAHGLMTAGTFTGIALTLNQVYFTPYLVPVRRSFDRIGIQVTTAGTAGALVRLGIYAAAGGVPTSLVVDAGTIAADTIGSKEATISVTLDPGLYWTAIVAQAAACSVVWYPSGVVTPFNPYRTTPQNASTHDVSKTQASVSGALPSTATASSTSSGAPALMLRAS